MIAGLDRRWASTEVPRHDGWRRGLRECLCVLLLVAGCRVRRRHRPQPSSSRAGREARDSSRRRGDPGGGRRSRATGYSSRRTRRPARSRRQYPGRSGVLFDGGAGFESAGAWVWRSAVSHASAPDVARCGGRSRIRSSTTVIATSKGEAPDVARTETAVHLQLYYDLTAAREMAREFFAGPSYFDVEQELVPKSQADRGVSRSTPRRSGRATTTRADGSAIGFNVGVDAVADVRGAGSAAACWSVTPRAAVDLNAPGRGVSTTAAACRRVRASAGRGERLLAVLSTGSTLIGVLNLPGSVRGSLPRSSRASRPGGSRRTVTSRLRPGARARSRAVGNIMRECRSAGVPCHRVIAAGGRLGGSAATCS